MLVYRLIKSISFNLHSTRITFIDYIVKLMAFLFFFFVIRDCLMSPLLQKFDVNMYMYIVYIFEIVQVCIE